MLATTSVLTLRVRGLHCAEESRQIEKRLRREPGIGALGFDYVAERLTVEHDADSISAEEIQAAVKETGLGVSAWHAPRPSESWWSRFGSFVLATLGGAAILAGTIREWGLGSSQQDPLATFFYLAAMLAGVTALVPRAWQALQRLRLDMNVLVLVALTAATVLGEYAEAAILGFLFTLASVIERWSRERAAALLSAHHHHHCPQAAGSTTELFIDRFARWYTPSVHVLAVLIAILLPTAALQTAGGALNAALLVLLTACPCALVLSTPITLAAALASGARRGVFARRASVIEQLANGRSVESLIHAHELSLAPNSPEQRDFAVQHARRAMRILRAGVAIAIAAKAAFLATVFVGQAAPWMAVASDLGATVLVTLLGLRMLVVNEPSQAPAAVPVRQLEQEP